MYKIRFVVKNRGEWPTRTPGTFTLIRDMWDDYHFKTSFHLHFAADDEVIDLGLVKIAQIGTEERQGPTVLPETFSELDDTYFSLGQSREYYEDIIMLPGGIGARALSALRDVAQEPTIFESVRNEPAFTASMLRSIPERTVVTQFRRITRGELALTAYEFEYAQRRRGASGFELSLDFKVDPESAVPTNCHVVIGANGVGKSQLLRNMADASAAVENLGGVGRIVHAANAPVLDQSFANIIYLSFSAFDQQSIPMTSAEGGATLHQVGLRGTSPALEVQYVESLEACLRTDRMDRWERGIEMLELADVLLADESPRALVKKGTPLEAAEVADWFRRLSSGHKIALLTVTRLVELIEEKSLILVDEPETHLHPPLLSALTRAIADLAVKRNGVAVIATHSPIVLQEVPKSCVWVVRRAGSDVRAERLQVESLGESLSRLTAEVFHLELTHTGYHAVINDILAAHNWDAEEALAAIEGRIGSEGKLVLYAIAARKGGGSV